MTKALLRPLYIRLFAITIISCLGMIIYSNTFNCSFHFDDKIYIVNNYVIKNIHDLLSHWQFYPCRFITFLSIAVNYHFNGLNVFGYHLFNLGIHLTSAVLVWWLALLTFSTPVMKKDKITQHADLIALFAGLLFVSHPLQTEAVTYIWQRAASMMALFYLASICLYVKSRLLQAENPNSGLAKFYYIFSLIMAVAAMFTKENAVTLPLMILLYEISFLKVKKDLNWRGLVPFLITLSIIPLTILLTRSAKFLEIQGFVGKGIPSFSNYLLTQFRVIVTYIRLIFLPLNQNISYDYPISKNIFEWPLLINFLFLASILYFAKYLFSKYRFLSFSIFWFFLTLLPESSLFPIKEIICEHRLYLPLAGYSIFLVSGAYYLCGKNSIKMMVIILTMIVAVNSVLTYQRNRIWENDITFWGDAVRKSPHKASVYHNLATAYSEKDDLMGALSNYNKAIEINPNYAEAYSGRGIIYSQQSNFISALSDFNRAIKINPTLEGAYYNRGNAYAKQGDFTQAIADYTKAVEIDPTFAQAHNNRGNIFSQQGDLPKALSDYNKAIEIDPNYAEAYINRGNTYSQQGNFTQALLDYNKAITINPHNAQAYSNRAIAYYLLKEYDKAWDDVHTVEALGGTVNPRFINALKNGAG